MLLTVFTSLLLILVTTGCKKEKEIRKVNKLPVMEIPVNNALRFLPELKPKNKLIHRGILSPDSKEYYYTLSDKSYKKFDVWMIRNNSGKWSKAEEAFINSEYNEHGMSFSPDGKYLYYSSTKPTKIEALAGTWRIWRAEKKNGIWSEAELLIIPSMEKKLVSHPTISNDGTLFFHAANSDYSQMDLYYSKEVNGSFTAARKLLIPGVDKYNKCTPYISPDGNDLFFAKITDGLQLMLSKKKEDGKWGKAVLLNSDINKKNQGNPFLTADGKYLFYATGSSELIHEKNDWDVNWVSISTAVSENNIE